MSVALLDVNVLLAMSWPQLPHNRVVLGWFLNHRLAGWATCPVTQSGFVRLSSHSGVVGIPLDVRQSMRALEDHCADPHHVFWPQDYTITEILPEIRNRLIGHHQLTDALLLDLAIRKGGRLVTLDKGIAHLLPAGSPHRGAIEIIPTDIP